MQPSGKRGSRCSRRSACTSATSRRRKRRRCCDSGEQNIDIPAGRAHYTITDSFVLPVDVEVQAVQPHAHYRAREIRGTATLPDGTTKDADPHQRLGFPVAARLSVRAAVLAAEGDDAVDAVHATTTRPRTRAIRSIRRRRAQWGQRSSDEMGDLWIQVLTRNEPDLVTLTTQFRTKVAAEDVNGYEARDRAPSRRCRVAR